MTRPSGDAMKRLVECTGAEQTDENRAAALLRGTFVPREPTGFELVRIARGVATGAVQQKRGRLVLRVALVFLCMLAGAATVKAYEYARRAAWLGKPAPAPERETRGWTASRRRPPSPALPTAAATETPQAPAPPETQERPSTPPAPPPAVRRPERSVAHAATNRTELATAEQRPSVREPTPLLPPAMPSTAPIAFPPAVRGSSWPAVSDEVRELDRAMGYLRRDHNPVAALATLDHYLDRYPHGSLQQEARQARIDALLMLGRNQQALAELEATSFDRGLRSTELMVVRAELRAAEDCPRAERDFTAALARSPDARLTERILYGRGVCRIKMQDTAAANDDVRSYLRRYPNGAHGDWARRWLASQRATEGER